MICVTNSPFLIYIYLARLIVIEELVENLKLMHFFDLKSFFLLGRKILEDIFI
jgi:hypothetical protein